MCRGALDQLFEVDLARSEAALRLAAGRRVRCRKLLRPRHCPHALAATSCSCLQHHGIADSSRHLHRLIDAGQAGHTARHARHPCSIRCLSCFGLRAQHPHRTCRRPDKYHSRRCAGLGEVCVFRQESVSRMNCISTCSSCNVEDQIAPQIALRRRCGAQPIRLIRMQYMQRGAVGIGVDGHRGQPHLTAGANHPQRNLAAIRNQHFFYRSSQAAILPQTLNDLRQSHYAAPRGFKPKAKSLR